MRIFRKRKKFGNFRGTPDEAPIPDIVYQMGAESAARYAAAQAMSPNPYDPMGQEAMYQYAEPHFVEEELYDEGVRASSPFRFMASALGVRSSRSREQHANRPMDPFVRAGSPIHFREQPPGTPVKFRRRAGSPGFIQPRASSPYHFAQQERVSSPYHFAQQERVPSPYHFAQQERVPSPLHFAASERVSSPVHFAHRSRPGSPEAIRRMQRAQLSQDLQRVERQQRRQQELMMMNPVQYTPQYYPMQQPPMYSYY